VGWGTDVWGKCVLVVGLCGALAGGGDGAGMAMLLCGNGRQNVWCMWLQGEVQRGMGVKGGREARWHTGNHCVWHQAWEVSRWETKEVHACMCGGRRHETKEVWQQWKAVWELSPLRPITKCAVEVLCVCVVVGVG